jgi:hypothetical protein
MSPRHAVVLLAWLLGACAQAAPEAPLKPAPLAAAAFTGPAAKIVEVVVTQVPPGTEVERIALIGPSGQDIMAREMTLVQVKEGAAVVPSYEVGASGGSGSGVNPYLGLGLSFWLFDDPEAHGDRYTARIPLPDPQAYHAEAERWRVEVRSRDAAGTPQVLTIPAPRAK